MKPKAIYLPGKTGDAFLQWPVAGLWLRQHAQQAEVWLDPTCKAAESLFAAQPTVSAVKIVEPAENYSCGGQPWHGKFSTADHEAYEIISLGFRGFPQRQITLQTALDCPLLVNTTDLATTSAFEVGEVEKRNICVLHGTFNTHMSGTPRFWRFLNDRRADLEARFDEIVFVGVADERQRAREVYSEPPYTDYDDGGDFLNVARLLAGARLVIGAGSSMAALGSALKVPTLRVHDPIGDAPKQIWSGLGKNQWNFTEIELRTEWPKILEALT